MSRWKLPTVVLATALLAGACTEDAAPPTGGATSRLAATEPGARHRPPRDDDGDRRDRPSRAELEARREVHKQEMLTRFDADHDGTLSADERAAAHQARVAEMIARLDSDKSGTLSAAEFEARPGRGGHHRGPDFATIDANHDGAVSVDELAAMRPPVPPPGPPPGDDDDGDRPPPPDDLE